MSVNKLYIDGEWVDGESTLENVNPSDLSDVEGIYAQASLAQADAAIAAANRAADEWGTSTPQQRFDILDAIGTELMNRKEEIGDLLAREEGKTKPEGIGETIRAAQIFKFFAGEALRQNGDQLDSVRPGVKVEVTREPVGVVAAITPWNFPIAIPAWKIAPALAYGNTVILKPAEITPGCARVLTEIIANTPLPKGAFNLLTGKGSIVGAALLDSDKVDAVSFTGSVGIGRMVRETVASRGGRVQLEMGGKNPLIVLDDADIDVAVDCALQGAFFSTGQRCTASSRLIVTQGIADKFVDALTAKVEALKVGDARGEGIQIGPVASKEQFDKVNQYIQIGIDEGAKLLAGGVTTDESKGYFVAPTLFDNTTPNMRINREEIFGPVASIQRAANYEEALELANDTEFGLSAGICTTSLKSSAHFKRHSKAGMVMVNLPTAGVDYHVPFGGRKGSSYGNREQGTYAKEFYTIVKTAYELPV